jgi:NAD(P)-dependent dehydrogenase (short-subunit alcohol dehydrogenase family)
MDDAEVAVVTGAAGGLGLGLASCLGARGMKVAIADIDEAALAKAGERLRAEGVEVLTVPTDVTKQEAVTELAGHVLDQFGRADVVCLNAAVNVRGRAWELSVSDWRWVYDVNVFGIVHGIRSFVPLLLGRGSGHVLITASNSSVTTLPELAPYVSSKHAVLSLAETLQHDLIDAGSAVLVSVILPGAIRTSRMPEAFRNRPAEYGPAQTPPADVIRASHALMDQYGTDPHDMAAGILGQALDEHRFAVFTDPADAAQLTARAEAIRDGQLAPVAIPVIKK